MSKPPRKPPKACSKASRKPTAKPTPRGKKASKGILDPKASPETCPGCNTILEIAPGIGEWCPNPKCDRGDHVHQGPCDATCEAIAKWGNSEYVGVPNIIDFDWGKGPDFCITVWKDSQGNWQHQYEEIKPSKTKGKWLHIKVERPNRQKTLDKLTQESQKLGLYDTKPRLKKGKKG